jgi:two-component system OmpR family sensor kinase
MSLRRRLLLAFAAVALVLAVADVVIIRTVHSNLYGQIDDRLEKTVERFVGAGGAPAPGQGFSGRPFPSETFLATWDAVTGTATVVGPQSLATDQPLPSISADVVNGHTPATAGRGSAPFTVDAVAGSSSWRLVVIRSTDGSEITIAGLPLASTAITSTHLTELTLAASGAVLLVLGLVGWWVIRLGLRPIDQLARTADEIAAGDLSRRLDPAPTGTEAGDLTEAFNGMIHQIEQAFAERQASEDRLRRFVADASHELRTPLTSIRGYTDLMRSGAIAEPAACEDALRRISGESARMAELVDDLLVLARLDQGRPLEREPVDLVGVVSDAVLDARAVAPEQPITLVTPSLPVIVSGDEGRLRQVVANLLTNARVHTPTGTPVAVRVAVQSMSAEVVVADEGTGIAPQVAERVFERFYRAEGSRSRDHGGSGLGLSIVSAVAVAHGGHAEVESVVGAGTRFTVQLPLA